MISIVMTDNNIVKWQKDEYNTYMYDGKFFIIKRHGECVGFYNLEYVISIIVKDN